MPNNRFRPLPIEKQVVVITGAEAGIGLATAQLAVYQGAQVIMSGKNGDLLRKAVNNLNSVGGKAIGVLADAAIQKDLVRVRDEALSVFGTIDTWINNQTSFLSGKSMESNIGDERHLFEGNFWGPRIGSRLAIETMSKNGGVLINVGSEVSLSSHPFTGIYMASKQALKTFTDALRFELRDKQMPVEVCTVRPASKGAPPYVTAELILKCAVRPVRDAYAGGPARLSAIIETLFPELRDMVTENKVKEIQRINQRN